jgi:hypothetical protein
MNKRDSRNHSEFLNDKAYSTSKKVQGSLHNTTFKSIDYQESSLIVIQDHRKLNTLKNSMDEKSMSEQQLNSTQIPVGLL